MPSRQRSLLHACVLWHAHVLRKWASCLALARLRKESFVSSKAEVFYLDGSCLLLSLQRLAVPGVPLVGNWRRSALDGGLGRGETIELWLCVTKHLSTRLLWDNTWRHSDFWNLDAPKVLLAAGFEVAALWDFLNDQAFIFNFHNLQICQLIKHDGLPWLTLAPHFRALQMRPLYFLGLEYLLNRSVRVSFLSIFGNDVLLFPGTEIDSHLWVNTFSRL